MSSHGRSFIFVSLVPAGGGAVWLPSGIRTQEREPTSSLFPFVLKAFPFPCRIYESSLSKSERICVDLDEIEAG